MFDYFKSRWQHLGECWSHAKSHRAVAVVLALGALYTAYTTWGSLVSLPESIRPDNLPKIPLPWALVIILAAVLFMVIEGSCRLHGSMNAFRTPKWEMVTGQRFTNEAIEVDGKRFIDCEFQNTKFVFHGKAPVDFRGNTQLGGSIRLETDNLAIAHYITLGKRLSNVPGAQTTTALLDANGKDIPRAFDVDGHPTIPLAERITTLCKEISKWVSQQGQRPDEDDLWNQERNTLTGFVNRYNKEIQPWDDKISAGYWLQFKEKVVGLRHELAIRGVVDEELDNALTELDRQATRTYMPTLNKAIQRLRYVASTLSD